MPLIESCSIDAYRENIRAEIKDGKSPDQAAAIARSTLESSCERLNQPLPEGLSKAKKLQSSGYLHDALVAAKKSLTGWQYTILRQAVQSLENGNESQRNLVSSLEKAWIEKQTEREMTNAQLQTALHKLNTKYAAYKRQGKDPQPIYARAQRVVGEMRKRKLPVKGGVAAAIKEKLDKGFSHGDSEGGMHAHGLDRRNAKTLVDGQHMHMYVLPGTGETFFTMEDGAHVHAIEGGGDKTESDGTHSHQVLLPDGRVVETRLGGAHDHPLMVETSGFGGLHTHVLQMPDGTEVQSLTPAQFVEQFVNLEEAPLPNPITSARELVGALNEAAMLREILHNNMLAAQPMEEVMFDYAKTGELPAPLTSYWEIAEMAKGGAYCELTDGPATLIANPDELDIEPGDVVEVSAEGRMLAFANEADSVDGYEGKQAYNEAVFKTLRSVDFSGPLDAPLIFVGASPSPMELARREALVGPDGAIFHEKFLKPLNLSKSDVAVGFAIPVDCENHTPETIDLWRDQLIKNIARFSKGKVVALGRVSKEALGPIVSYSLPHPAALRRHGDRGEVGRKLKTIAKNLDIKLQAGEDRNSSDRDPSKGNRGRSSLIESELGKSDGFQVAVTKAVEEKQIVYGVVLDPYQVDAHNDWIPPKEIESTAHDFLEKSRVVGLRHKGKADAQIVESWVELYPSTKDRELALCNEPHKVFRRQFGSDVLHSGAWVAGVKLSDELWDLHKRGELDAFSIGGFSFKKQINSDAMPAVEFVDLTAA